MFDITLSLSLIAIQSITKSTSTVLTLEKQSRTQAPPPHGLGKNGKREIICKKKNEKFGKTLLPLLGEGAQFYLIGSFLPPPHTPCI